MSRPIFTSRLLFARWFFFAAVVLTVAPLRGQPPGPVEGPVVMLPPMMVEARGVPLKWIYFQAEGLEVLAACDEKIAADFVQRKRQLDEGLRAILPERYMAVTSVPEILILIDEKVGQAQAREVLANSRSWDSRRVVFLPNLGLVDQDSNATFALVNASTPGGFNYTAATLSALLERRVPRLPGWLIEGMRGFYRQMGFGERLVMVGSAAWVSDREFAALAADPYWPRVLLPMEEFFAHEPSVDGEPAEAESEWRAQAALFVRWALVENNRANAPALWKFVDRLEREPLSEALFREHFGIGYSDMRDQLSDYLAPAIRQRTDLASPATATAVRPPRPKFRPATGLEIARIRGDWERLEIDYVRKRSPWLVEKYVGQARATFARAYERGERDPRLLAGMGLTELEAGNPAGALPLLVDAVAGRVVRPRAYFELARLRYGAALTESGPTGKMNATQVSGVLEPLFAGQRLPPPLLENYMLFAAVLNRSDSPPTAAQLAALHEGARKFPEVSELVLRAIYFHLVSGQPAAAATLTEAGLLYARGPVTRAKFERASAAVSGANKPGTE